jgi:hypothetical protein
VEVLRIEEHNGVHLIIQDRYENFWQQWSVDPRISNHRPKLKDSLKKWWDETAPGEWTTTYVNGTITRAIVIRDPKLFILFKLAFTNTEDLSGAIVILEGPTYVYAPYVPLTKSGV